MHKILMAAAALTAVAMAGGAKASTDLITNGGFEQNTLPSSLVTGNVYSGAGISHFWNHYAWAVTGWTSVQTGAQEDYNIYVFDPAHATTRNADAYWTSAEPQHLNSNFTGASPDGGAFMLLDGDPGFSGALQQSVNLVAGQAYTLSFDWAAGELSDRTGYQFAGITGSIGGFTFAPPVFNNTAAAGQPGAFSGWQQASYTFTAQNTGPTLLSFLAVGGPQANLPPVALLDGVHLTPVPEPASWALILGGFGGMGLAIRRRRAAAAA